MSSIPNSYIDDIRRIAQSILNQLEHLKVRWLTGVERINNAEWSDVNYGVTVCTSTTRPTGYDGRTIYETDTDNMLVYNGASWVSAGGTNYSQSAQVCQIPFFVSDDSPMLVPWAGELWDTDNIFSGIYPYRLTCKTAGIYQISAAGRFVYNNAGVYKMRILRTDDSTTEQIAVITRSHITSDGPDLHLNQIIQMEVDDYVELEVYQNTGSINSFGGAYEDMYSLFTMQRLPG